MVLSFKVFTIKCAENGEISDAESCDAHHNHPHLCQIFAGDVNLKKCIQYHQSTLMQHFAKTTVVDSRYYVCGCLLISQTLTVKYIFKTCDLCAPSRGTKYNTRAAEETKVTCGTLHIHQTYN